MSTATSAMHLETTDATGDRQDTFPAASHGHGETSEQPISAIQRSYNRARAVFPPTAQQSYSGQPQSHDLHGELDPPKAWHLR